MALNNQVTSTPATVDSVVEQYIGPQVQTEDLNASGSITINGVPVSGGTAWGDITGTLADQTDLQAALDAKLNGSTPVAATSFTLNPTSGTGNIVLSSSGSGGGNNVTVVAADGNTTPVSALVGTIANSTASAALLLNLRRSRGTAASPTGVNSGDTLGFISFSGYDGSAFGAGGTIQSTTTEAWTGSARGTALLLGVRPTGSTTNQTVFRVTHNGTNAVLSLPIAAGTNILASGDVNILDGSSATIASFSSTTGLTCSKPFSPPAATLSMLPAATTAGQVLFVSDANSGVGTIAFSDGSNWIDVKTGTTVA